MPVYLCKPGVNSLEPWRHGIPVYAEPFDLGSGSSTSTSTTKATDSTNDDQSQPLNVVDSRLDIHTGTGTGTGTGTVNNNNNNTNNNNNNNTNNNNNNNTNNNNNNTNNLLEHSESRTQPNSETSSMTGVGPQHNSNATAIRRIRHSEVVLVDDVVYQHNNYWLRLRWPGTKGGFAGYVCLLAHQNTILSSSSSSSMDGRKAQDSHNMQSGESKVKVKSTIRFDSIRSDPILFILYCCLKEIQYF
jgi:hypothetical protein